MDRLSLNGRVEKEEQLEAEEVRTKPGYLFAALKVNLSEPNREVKRSLRK
jgi:hypothetical protein